MQFRCKYEYHIPFGNPKHVWTCIGRHGAVHFHVTDMGADFKHGDQYSGGLEVHYRQPPEYMKDNAPSQDKCWLLGCPCWHDGTSLYAQEKLIPFWLVSPHDHERIFKMLQLEYRDRFEPKADEIAA